MIAITGPVVDIEFPQGQLPAIYNAVEIQREGEDSLVVRGPAAPRQQLGALCGHDHDRRPGARRDAVIDTGAPISVPVGPPTLGRVFDVLGQPIDEKGPVEAERALPDPPRSARPSRTRRPRPRSSRRASRSST